MMRASRILLIVGLAASPSVGIAAMSEFGPFSLQIAPNSFEERCVKLAAGASLRYRFKASAAVDFNLHYHRGNDVFYPAKKAAVTQRVGRFRAKSEAAYCLMWENRTNTVVTIDGSVDSGPPARAQKVTVNTSVSR